MSEACQGAVEKARRKMQIDTMFVTHNARVMKTKLRNVTVTLDEQVARWAGMEAARKDTSVSRLLGGILRERMLEKDGYEGAKRRALSRKPFLKTDAARSNSSRRRDSRAFCTASHFRTSISFSMLLAPPRRGR